MATSALQDLENLAIITLRVQEDIEMNIIVLPVLLARSIVSLTDSRPSKSSSGTTFDAMGLASSREPRLPEPPVPFAFLASARFNAIASLMLSGGGGGGCGCGVSSCALGLEGVVERVVDFVRVLIGVVLFLTGVPIRDFVGVEGCGLGMREEGTGTRDIAFEMVKSK